jgi:hypothetical protein
MMVCIGRFSIKFHKDFNVGIYDNLIMDVRGISLGYFSLGWWYDDIPEGLK